MSNADIAVRELDWYLRDHFFRQSAKGRNAFMRESLPNEMVELYLRYRGNDPGQLSETMTPVIQNLVSRKVVGQNGSELTLNGSLARLQCSKCFYINYLADGEPRECLRCRHLELHDFPRKKA
jgi:hypothetical protein